MGAAVVAGEDAIGSGEQRDLPALVAEQGPPLSLQRGEVYSPDPIGVLTAAVHETNVIPWAFRVNRRTSPLPLPLQQPLRLRQILRPIGIEERVVTFDREFNHGHLVALGPGVHLADAFLHQGATQILGERDRP